MHESQLGHMVDPIREMIYQSDLILQGFKEKTGASLAGISCDILPVEIVAAAGVVPLRIPFFYRQGCCGYTIPAGTEKKAVYDSYIVPEACTAGRSLETEGLPVYTFKNPSGYGDEARQELHRELHRLLKNMGAGGTEALDMAVLRVQAEQYNVLRRVMRGISALRKSSPGLLSNDDLMVLFEAASVFPPQIIAEHLAFILKSMHEKGAEPVDAPVQVMAYAGIMGNAMILDEIEELGCLVAEDDFCNGRRQFDLSINTSSSDLYDEILDAFTYRPLCPVVRSVEERYELLYKLLKSHGIDIVLFLTDSCCAARKEDIDYLRVRLMRSGVDPLMVTGENALAAIREYIKIC